MFIKKIALSVLLLCSSFTIFADQPIKLASTPALSPDGKELTFMWQGELWQTKTDDGYAIPITLGSSTNLNPFYAPDGKTIFFQSNKDEEGSQIYSMKSSGGATTRITYDTQGYNLLDISSDGKYLLASVNRNYTGAVGQRIVKITIDGSRRDQLVFDGYATNAKISPDGNQIIFTREGGPVIGPYRQGYRGTGATQLWLYDLKTKAVTNLKLERYGNRAPIWNPSGKSFYYTSEKDGCYNLYEYTLDSKAERQLTFFKDAPVLIPTISRDGKTLVFRQLFDFYQIDPTISKPTPKKINLIANSFLKDNTFRRYLNEVVAGIYTGDLEFTDDGLEVAMATGGSLYVMDTVLCKPVKVDGNSGSQITELEFSKDFKTIYYLKDVGTSVNIWKAEVTDPSKFWWQNSSFKTSQITKKQDNLSNLGVSPDGKKLSYQKGRGTLAVCDLDGSNERIIKKTPYQISYSWAPDSIHLIGSFQSSDGVRNIWILTADGSDKPYSISRSPGWSGFETWSPDGKTITYFNRRSDGAFFLHWLTLDKKIDEQTALDLKKKKALEKMATRPKPITPKKEEKVVKSPKTDKTPDAKIVKNATFPRIEIDYQDLEHRVHKIRFACSSPTTVFWSWDSKKLIYSGNAGGKSGTYTLEAPTFKKERRISEKVGYSARCTGPKNAKPNQTWSGNWNDGSTKILWTLDSKPAIYSTILPISIYQTIDKNKRQALAFKQIWRGLRDNFCDPDLKMINWKKMLYKYLNEAKNAVDNTAFDRIVGMLNGELNASHLGWWRNRQQSTPLKDQWHSRTFSLGVIYEDDLKTGGLRITHVVRGSQADLQRSKLNVGDVITAINGTKLKLSTNVAKLLTDVTGEQFVLSVNSPEGVTREVTIKGESYNRVRSLISEQEIIDNRSRVSELSDGKIGYLNIKAMNQTSLTRFEEEVYSQGFGKDGLVIDVRNNGGGWISDRLLSILCQPKHAITIPRDGKQSYPYGYVGRVSWQKPIIILCNQRSCSNAEIFTHAIKTLKRGKIVGIETNGYVISAPEMKILDMGTLRIPDRAWWTLSTMQDMEERGAVPDFSIWPIPGDLPKGIDTQLNKAVTEILKDVKNLPPEPVLIRRGHVKPLKQDEAKE